MKPRILLVPLALVGVVAALTISPSTPVHADETRDRAQLRARIKLLEVRMEGLEKLIGEQQAMLEELRLRRAQAPRESSTAEARRRDEVLSKAEELFTRARSLEEAKRYPDALESLQRALELRPEHVGTLRRIAEVLDKLGRRAESVELAKRALDLINDPRSPDARELRHWLEQRAVQEHKHGKRAEDALKKGDFVKALQSLDRALRDRPDDVQSLILKAKVLAQLKRFEDAKRVAKRALELVPRVDGRPDRENPRHRILEGLLRDLERQTEEPRRR
jgi:tetratricopeptide (TPR) repeat protein